MTTCNITIYTDGACSGNPGSGGWGAVLIYKESIKEISGFEKFTTNNKMELQAVIEALKTLKKPCNIDLYTDSIYVKDGITKWVKTWKENGWKTSKKEEVKNREFWVQLDDLTSLHQINWNWVKGHSDNKYNNIVDKLARNESLKNKQGSDA